MKNFKISPRVSIADEVYEFLRKQILIGEITGSDRLTVSELAEKLEVSRTPVRESLQKLEMEKLIVSLKPKAGYMVKSIDEDDVSEICDIRMVTEALAAKRASNNITPKELDRLDKIVDLEKEFIQKNDRSNLIELDTEFHDIICKTSRSPRIEEINQKLRDLMLGLRIKALWVRKIALISNEGHRRIADAIRSKDTVAIEQACISHVGSTKQHVIDLLVKERQESKAN